MSHSHQLFAPVQIVAPAKNPLITESTDIKDLRAYCKPNTTLVLDLDNTLIEPEDAHDELGSDQWFSALCKYAAELDLTDISKPERIALALTIYSAVEHHVQLRLIQAETRDVIREYHAKGNHVLFLTARGPEISEPTLRQLERNDVDLSLRWGTKVREFEVEHNGKIHTRIFKNGGIFCGGLPKAKCLAAVKEKLLAEDVHLHKSVIMVDDKYDYLSPIIQMIVEQGGEAKGVHFRRMDEKVKNHDFAKAQLKLFAMRSQLSIEAQDAMDKLQLRP